MSYFSHCCDKQQFKKAVEVRCLFCLTVERILSIMARKEQETGQSHCINNQKTEIKSKQELGLGSKGHSQ